jgi:hypothetical protein
MQIDPVLNIDGIKRYRVNLDRGLTISSVNESWS